MATLPEKLIQLKAQAVAAIRVAECWEQQIVKHGEVPVEAFYKYIGLNHIESKGVQWEGLTLSRQPTEAEKLQVKSVAAAQESARERLANLLLSTRNVLIRDALAQLDQLSPRSYHELIVTVPDEDRQLLREAVIQTFNDGKLTIAAQVGMKQGNDEFDELDDLTELTESRLANDVQSRITGAATRFALLGQVGASLINSVQNEIQSGSVSYIDRAATGLANRTINLGRQAEADNHGWDHVEYSALLDLNVCLPCAAADGETANDADDLTPAPNPECAGGDWCRCFWVWITR